MIEHIATVRDRAITWDKREVVQHGLNSDTIRVDADSEFTNCDALALILFNASNPRPMRYMVDETLTVRIPSALMEQTGALSVCLIGYVGGAVRIVTKQERMPLVVVKSGETGGIDPDDGNPDLWGQLLAAEAARVEAENGREAAEALRVAAETARVAAETEREKDSAAAVKAANDAAGTASKAAEKAKADTDAAVAKTEEATNAAVAKADKATASATTAANKAEAAVSKLPLPLGNTLKGKVEATLVNVDDAYPAPLVTAKVMGQSNQQQEPAPSPENPQEITNLNKAELVITGRNLVEQSTTTTNDLNRFTSCLFVEADLMPSTNYVLSFNDVVGNGYYINEFLFSNFHEFTTKSGRNVVKLSTKAEISKANAGQYAAQGWIILKNSKNQDKAPAFTDVQIELGDTATAYEPHKSKSTPIDLKGNELLSIPNGVRDEVVIDAEGNVSLIKRVAKYVVPENVYAQDESNNFGVKLELNAVDDKYLHKQLCPANAKYSPSVNWLTVYKKNGNWANLQEFKQWLIGTVFYYGTKNPETIPLGKVELPALPEATSNIWNDGNIQTDVGITYVRDANIVIGRLEDKLARVAYGNL